MTYSPNQKYPGATNPDPNYKDGIFRDNNPSTTNNGSPLKAIDRNELLARDEAIMNDAGFEYNGLPDTPQDSQLFKAYKASLGNGANLLSNHNFLTSSPDTTGPDATQPPPSATPTSYPPGFQIFSGVFANETTGILNLTYIDGRVSFSGGDFYMAVPNTGGIERATDFAASVADFDGKPRTRGVSFALVGDEYRVTVGVDALEDVSANPTPLGSVKFEQGLVPTGHEAEYGVLSLGSSVPRPDYVRFADEVNVEDYGAVKYKQGGDKAANAAINNIAFAKANDVAWARQSNLVAKGHFCLSSKLTIKQLSPVGTFPNTNNQGFICTGVIENIGTDYWLQVESQSAIVKVQEQRGEFTASGIYVTKQGDTQIDVGFSRDLSNHIVYNEAFSHTVYPGLIIGGETGINIEHGNSLKVIGGRLGGNPTLDETNPNTSKYGVDIKQGAANCLISPNIEYAKRDSDSWALRDSGLNTLVLGGYFESCSGGLLQALGRDGRFMPQALATGVYNQDAILDRGVNNTFEVQETHSNKFPSTDTANSTLGSVFPSLSYRVNPSTKITSRNSSLTNQSPSVVRNLIKSSSDFDSGDWAFTPISGFTGEVVNLNTSGSAELGFSRGASFDLPLQDARDKQYLVSQSGVHLTPTQGNLLTFGGYFHCETGKVDILLKVVTGNYYYTKPFSVCAPEGSQPSKNVHWQSLCLVIDEAVGPDATIQIYMRPTENSKVNMFGLSMYEWADIGALPQSESSEQSFVTAGRSIDGDTFHNGYMLNGNERFNSKFIPATTVMTEFQVPLYEITNSQTLPSPENTRFKTAKFKNTGVGAVSLLGSIDGSSSISVPANGCVELYSTGLEYWVLSSHGI